MPIMRDQLLAIQSYKKFNVLGTVYNPIEPNSVIMIEELKRETSKIGIKLIALPVDVVDGLPSAKSIPKKIDQLKRKGAEWLYIGPDTFTGFTNRRITTFHAITARLPSFTANESAMRTGHALYGMF